jgi:CubicO group peptidase (beta-lactamase class C family)
MDLEALQGELEEKVGELMEALHVPGVAVGVLHGRQELVSTFGVTNLDHPLPVTDETLFQIGSTTKTFTGTALMRKVDDGSLDLDAPLQSYLPEFALANDEWAERVTPRHLLTHTGGWDGDFLLLHPVGERGDDALQRAVEALAGAPLLTPPGTLFHYNNFAFSVAGRLLEVLTGQTYEAAIRELVFEPLELRSSCFLPEDLITRRFAVGHTHRNVTDPPHVAHNWALHRSSSAAGAIASDVRDQLRYARFHLGDGKAPSGERLLRAESMARMQSPQAEVAEDWGAIGISWILGSHAGARTVGHGGATNGQISAFQMLPEHDFALALLTNADSGTILNPQLTSFLLERSLGLTAPEPEALELPTAALDEYAGTYEREMFELEVRREGSTLAIHVEPRTPPAGWEPVVQLPPAPLGFVEPDRAIVLDGFQKGTRGTFIRDGAGAIEWLRWGHRLHRRRET